MSGKTSHIMRVVICGGMMPAAVGCNVDARRLSYQDYQRNVDVIPERSVDPKGGVDIAVVEPREVDIVENLVAHREAYRKALEQLRNYYQDHGYADKTQWAAYELKGLQGVKQFRYLLDAEVASDTLRPAEVIAEADALYEQGLKLLRGGGHGVPAIYREDRMIQAARVFRSVIEQHPTSDKIDDAAFYLGEIHKEYLPDQEQIAVKWYERAWTWNPQTPHPARFQAAVVYDYRLHDRDRALELYRGVTRHESAIPGNVRWAVRRIEELTGGSAVPASQQP